MVDWSATFDNMLTNIINEIPAILAAIAILIIGYIIGTLVGRAINRIVEKMGIEKSFDASNTGKAFRASGLDLSDLIGGVVKAFIFILAIILAIQVLNLGGTIGSYLAGVADYLPRLLGGILIIILGVVFVDFLSSFIRKMIRPMFPPAKAAVTRTCWGTCYSYGLIAFVLLLAFNTMLLSGDTVYPLILGFVIIGAGIILTDILIKSIMDDYADFKDVAGYAKFVLYAIFLIIGTGAIFATFPGVTNIIANISWAFVIAFALLLVPVAYSMTKKMIRPETPSQPLSLISKGPFSMKDPDHFFLPTIGLEHIPARA